LIPSSNFSPRSSCPAYTIPSLKKRIKKITLQQLSCSDLSSPTTANGKQQQEKRVPKKKSRRRNSHNLKQENKPTTKQSQLEARRRAVHLIDDPPRWHNTHAPIKLQLKTDHLLRTINGSIQFATSGYTTSDGKASI
jgi:hypothetical protein